MNGFAFAAPARRRRPGLTAMIDVVFLLLIFFMLAARFGVERALPLAAAPPAAGAAWQGAPRLVEIAPAALRLNGAPVTETALPAALAPLLPAPDAPVLLRAVDGATIQRVLSVSDLLAGIGAPALVE